MKVISHILLLFDIKHMLFFLRGQLSNLDKLDKIAKVNIGRGLVMFLSLSFTFPQSHSQTMFCLVNPLPEFSVTVTVRQNDSVRAIRGQTVMVFDCITVQQANANYTPMPLENTYATTETAVC